MNKFIEVIIVLTKYFISFFKPRKSKSKEDIKIQNSIKNGETRF